MYLKLGNAVLNYSNEIVKDSFMIFAEIVDSTISYERPVLVRTAEELDIWFGKYFSSYFYLKQLLQNDDVVLYLYKPVEILTESINEENLVKGDFENKTDLPEVGNLGMFYYVKSEDTYYRYYYNSWITKNEYDSLNYYEVSGSNRDTLVLTSLSNKFFSHFHPAFESKTSSYLYRNVSLFNDDIKTQLVDLDIKKLQDKTQTLAFRILSTRSILEKDCYYLIPSVKQGELGSFRVFTTPKSTQDSKVIENSLNEVKKRGVKFVEGEPMEIYTRYDLVTAYISCGYYIDDMNLSGDYGYFTAYSLVPLNNIVINTIPSVTVDADVRFNNTILANLSKDNGVFFYSKTIGRTSDLYDNDRISVKIEKLGETQYRIVLKKYEYEEVFEGPINSSSGTERLDYLISKNSKLVYCDFINTTLGIREGSYTLEGSYIENSQTPEEYINSMDLFISWANERDIFPDYVMIPDFTKYIAQPSNHEIVYRLLREYAKLLNTQFLIQNFSGNEVFIDLSKDGGAYSGLPMSTMTTEINTIYRINAVEGDTDTVNHYIFSTPFSCDIVEDIDRIRLAECENNYVFNLNDPENRLLYFYQNCTINNIFQVPLYYIYIQGLLNDIYSYSSKAFTLDLRVEEGDDPYEISDLEKKLQKYKSNYMVCNNQMYYFKKYQDGDSYETSGWMRFVLGKIYRELQKDRHLLFGEKFKDKIETEIKNSLGKVESRFSIIKSLNIEQLVFDDLRNSVTLTINVRVKQLVNEDMTLDFILNYNT